MSEDAIPQADREGDLPHPRCVYDLFGQDAAEALAAEAFSSGRMHHAWMITGPKGVGKATFAYRLARRALGAQSDGLTPLGHRADDPVCHRIEVLSQPDLLVLRRPFNDKTGKLRAEITVDESRKAPEFFSKSASGSAWRVCIVDAADDLNPNAANALLKTLEEPPERGLLLLLVNAPGRLPNTVRSRCRTLVLRPPAVDATAGWLVERHGLDAQLATRCADLAGGAPGRALALAQTDAPALKQTLDGVLAALPRLDRKAVAALAVEASKKDAENVRHTLMEFLAGYAREQARHQVVLDSGVEMAGAWARAADSLARLARDSETLYLDPKQTIFAAFAILQGAAATS